MKATWTLPIASLIFVLGLCFTASGQGTVAPGWIWEPVNHNPGTVGWWDEYYHHASDTDIHYETNWKMLNGSLAGSTWSDENVAYFRGAGSTIVYLSGGWVPPPLGATNYWMNLYTGVMPRDVITADMFIDSGSYTFYGSDPYPPAMIIDPTAPWIPDPDWKAQVPNPNYHPYALDGNGNVIRDAGGNPIPNPDPNTNNPMMPNPQPQLQVPDPNALIPNPNVTNPVTLYGRKDIQNPISFGLSNGQMTLSTSGTTTLNLRTMFDGGYVFNAGTIALRHNEALGVFIANDDPTTPVVLGTYVDPDGVDGHTSPSLITETWGYSQGVVDVRGGGADSMTITTGADTTGRSIQTRFIVSGNKNLTFQIPYFGNDSNAPTLLIHGVDTHGFTNSEGDAIQGGALYLAENATMTHIGLSGTSQPRPGQLAFQDNTAVRGGAIYASNNLTISGNTRFENNKAVGNDQIRDESKTGYGGAIYMAGLTNMGLGGSTLTLNAAHDTTSSNMGDILFRGNTATNNTGAAVDNAIFLAKNTKINVVGNRYIYFEDGIMSGDDQGDAGANNSLSVNLLSTADIGNGFIQFSTDTDNAGNPGPGGWSTSLLNPKGVAGGQVDILSGEFRITDKTTFITYGNNAVFTVHAADNSITGNRGGVLGGNGTIEAQGGFVIRGEITPDSYKYVVPQSMSGSASQRQIPSAYAIGTLNFKGSVLLDTALLSIDTSAAADPLAPAAKNVKQSDRFGVTLTDLGVAGSNNKNDGRILLSPGTDRSTVVISDWYVGKYVIGTSSEGIFNADGSVAVDSSTIMEYFNPVVLAGNVGMQGRQGASIYVSFDELGNGEHDIVLETSNGSNLYVVWTGEDPTSGSIWENSGTTNAPKNWRSTRTQDTTQFETLAQMDVKPMERTAFQNGDYVYFNAARLEKDVNVSTIVNTPLAVTVAGMEILDGNNYTFNGDPNTSKITGSITGSVGGVTPTGKLRISTQSKTVAPTGTKVQFNIETDFIGGTELSNDASVVIMNAKALGAYDDNTSDTKGTVRVTRYVDYNGETQGNGKATVVTGVEGAVWKVQNHFIVEAARDAGDRNQLTLQIDGESFTVEGVDTTQSNLLGGAFFVGKNADLIRTGTGRLEIIGNSAKAGAGIYAEEHLTVNGNTVFKDNTADAFTGKSYSAGDDIYMVGSNSSASNNLILDATTGGDIVMIKTGTPTANDTSVFLNQRIAMAINTVSGNNVFLDGAIKHNDGGLGGNTLSMSGGGIVQLRGENVLNTIAKSGGSVTIGAGTTFRLAGGVGETPSFTTGGLTNTAMTFGTGSTLAGRGVITVGASNMSATTPTRIDFTNVTISPDSDVLWSALGRADNKAHLTVGENDYGTDGKTQDGNKVKIGEFTLGNGIDLTNFSVSLNNTTFKVDVGEAGDYDAGQTGEADRIIVNGNVNLTTAGKNKLTVNTLQNLTDSSGDYLLMVANGANGFGVTGENTADYFEQLATTLRQGGDILFKESTSGSGVYDQLWLINFTGGQNLKVYWTGKENTDWDAQKSINWITGRNGTETDFYNNDYVIFDDSTTTGVAVTDYNVALTGSMTVSGMEIVAGAQQYNFTGLAGTTITGKKAGTLPAVNQTGRLDIKGGTSKFSVATDFVEGTVLSGGKVIVDNAAALGVYNHQNYVDSVNSVNPTTASKQGYVNVTGPATVAVDAGTSAVNARVVNRFNVANNTALTFDIANGMTFAINNVDATTGTTPASGGAMVLGNGASINNIGTGLVSFNGNKAVNGGAISVATGNASITGNTQFLNNQGAAAGGKGGAVYMGAGNLTLNAVETTIGFQGNTAGGGSNGVYLDGASNLIINGSITSATNVANAYFGDAIRSGGTANNMTVNGGRTVINSASIGTNNLSGGLTVATGAEVALGTGAGFQAAATGTVNGTLSGAGTYTGNLDVIGGTLSPDSYTYTYNTATNTVSRSTGTSDPIGTLTIDGNLKLDGATLLVNLGTPNTGDLVNVTGTVSYGTTQNKVTINRPINDGSFNSGEFGILHSVAGLIDLSKFYVDPTNYGKRNSADLKLSADGKTLILTTESTGSGLLYWTGRDDSNWYALNSSFENWNTALDGTGTSEYFLDYDEVIFANDIGQNLVKGKTVNLFNDTTNPDKNIYVSGMTITGTNYNFVGNGMTIKGQNTADLTIDGTDGANNATIGAAVDFDNDLIATNGASATFTNTAKFDNDVKIDNSNITFNELTVGHDLTASTANTLRATGDVKVANNASITNVVTTTLEKNLTVTNGNLNVTDNRSTASDRFEVRGATDVKGNVSITNIGDVVLGTSATSGLKVGGNLTIDTANTASVGGDAIVTGAANFKDVKTTTLSGTFMADSLTSSNATQATSFNAVKAVTTTKNTTIDNVKTVSFGDTLRAQQFLVNTSNGSSDSLTVNGMLTTTGLTDIRNVGTAAFNAGANVGGVTNIQNVGTATFKKSSSFTQGMNITDSTVALVEQNTNAVGTTMSGTSTVVLGNNGALGTGNVTVANAANATVKSSIYELTVGNTFDVNGTGQLTFEANAGIVNVDGQVNMGVGSTLIANAVNASDTVNFRNRLSATGDDGFVKNGAGYTVFTQAGNSISGPVTINGGGMQIATGADFTTAGITTVNNGGTLFVKSGGQYAAQTIEVKQGGILTGEGSARATTFDLTNGTVAPGDRKEQGGVLTLDGNVKFDNTTLAVDLISQADYDQLLVRGGVTYNNNNKIDLSQWVSGTYDLVLSDLGKMTGFNETNWTLMVGGTAVDVGGRFSHELRQTSDGVNDILQLYLGASNASLVWNGTESGVWDNATKNWKNGADDDLFIAGDTAIFNSSAKTQGTITVSGTQTVSDMRVDSGNYTFTGDSIIGKINSAIEGSKGELNIKGGTVTFDTTGAFEGNVNLSGGKTTLTANGSLQSNKDFVLNSGATLELNPATNSIVAGNEVKLNGNVIVNRPATDGTIENVITAGVSFNYDSIFVKSYGLILQDTYYHDAANKYYMDLIFTKLGLDKFADINDLCWNESEVADSLTEIFKKGQMEWLESILYGMESTEDIIAVLDNLRGTEIIANANAMALWSPWTKVFRQFFDDFERCCPKDESVRGQAMGRWSDRSRNVWFDGYYRYTGVRTDGNARAYHENRGGMMIGLDKHLNCDSLIGITFGYGEPRQSSGFGRINAQDYTIGLYTNTRLGGDVYFNGFMGYGMQSYEYSRNAWIDQYKNEYDGEAFYVSGELVRPYVAGPYMTLFPTVALDYQRSWSDGFTEQGSYMALAQRMKNSSMERFVGRLGLNGKFRHSQSMNILTRFQYGFLISGDKYGKVDSFFVNGGASAPAMNLRGVNLGNHQLNVGIGGEWYVGPSKRLKLFGDYDFDCGSHRTAHTGQLGASILW